MLTDPDDSVDEQAATWFIRLRADNVGRNDKAAFIQWLEQDDKHRTAFYETCLMWDDTDLLKGLIDSAKKHGIAPRKPTKRFINLRIALALAACLVLAVSLGQQFYLMLNADYSSAVGERLNVRLSDGSTAMLNTDSAVAIKMENGRRVVELLKGEAYFDVKPDPGRPFIVQASQSTTRVLGTRFFVHRHHDNAQVKVLSGRVEVSDNRSRNRPALLRDGDEVTITDTVLGEPHKLDSTLSTSWIKGYLDYENETLEAVVKHIDRNHNGMILFKDDSLRNLKLNGRLKIRDSGEMLKVLQKTLSIKITYLTDWIVIIG